MKVALVFGGHVGIDPVKVSTWLINHYVEYGPFSKLVEGGAPGADHGGELFAMALGIPHHKEPAEWDRYGNSAGPIRNRKMLMEQQPDIAFGFPGKTGTRNMIQQIGALQLAGSRIELITVKGDFSL